MVEQWVKDIVGNSPLAVGNHYLHPKDGIIKVIGGRFWGEHGVSNFWFWEVLETGETHNGYGDEWPLVENPEEK